MTEETFWAIIDELDGVIDDDSVDSLVERLASLTPQDVEAFCAHLGAKVGVLAELPLAGLAVPDVADSGRAAPPLAGDAHENLLYAIVASGRHRYESVTSDPSTVEAEEWDAGEAELLIDAAATFLWDAVGVDWFDEVDPFRGHPRDNGWYETYRGSAWKGLPGHYLTATQELDQKLNQSEEWATWWGQTSLRKVKVGITINSDANRHKIERGRNIAKAKFEMDRSYLVDRDPGALKKLVAEEATFITGAIAAEFRMSPPPALP